MMRSPPPTLVRDPRMWKRILAAVGGSQNALSQPVLAGEVSCVLEPSRWPLWVPATLQLTAAVAATGDATFTFPDGDTWQVSAFRVFLSTGTYTFVAFLVSGSGSNPDVLVDSFAAATDRNYQPPHPWFIQGGGTITISVDSFTGAGNVLCDVLGLRAPMVAPAIT